MQATAVAPQNNDKERSENMLRLESMTFRGKMPKPGEHYWTYCESGFAECLEWFGNVADFGLYWMGNVHANEAKAKHWGHDFAAAFGLKRAI